ncbi:MAG TPA: hypothetical protein VGR62_11590 [Candidatus Binatia bacterium]|jgi:hypothetical protein|nr:hypothetical protein [Candidatus Binatia bacterium]
MTRAIVILLAALLVGSAPAPAGAAACVRRNGKLVLRDACKKSEHPLDTATLTPVGPTGSPGATGEPGAFPLRFVDDAEREIGPAQWFEFGAALVLVSHSTFPSPVPFAISRNGFGNIGDDDFLQVLYADADCAGQPYLSSESGAYAHVEGTAAYRAGGGPASVAVLAYETDSFMLCPIADATDRGTCCIASAFSQDAVPVERIPLDDLGFTPPFRAVLR